VNVAYRKLAAMVLLVHAVPGLLYFIFYNYFCALKGSKVLKSRWPLPKSWLGVVTWIYWPSLMDWKSVLNIFMHSH